MNKNSVFLILLTISLFVLIVQAQDKQTTENQTNYKAQERQVKMYDVPVSTQEAFLNALRAEKKPGGIVLVNRSCAVSEIKTQVEREYTSLNTALNLIVKQDPWYSWSIEQGVVNLIPTNDEPDFLKIQIKKFRLDGDLNLHLALEKLLRLPEVESKATEINLNKIMYGGLQSPRETKSRLKFELRNVTLRQALNEIVRKDEIAVWKYYESNCNGKISSSLDLSVR